MDSSTKITKKRKLNSTSPNASKKRKRNSTVVTDDGTRSDYELLAETHNLSIKVAKTITELFKNENTIPFIARYRKHEVGDLEPDQLRAVKESYEDILELKSKIQTVLKSIEKTGKATPAVRRSVSNAQSLEELELLYAPYKSGSKRTYAERAKALGLEAPALKLLHNRGKVDLNLLIDPKKTELGSLSEVEAGIVHIISAVLSTDADLLAYLRKLRCESIFHLECTKRRKVASKANEQETKPVDESKYALYFNFKIPIKFLKPHQVLAINRGEAQKALSVKIVAPQHIFVLFSNFCNQKWKNPQNNSVRATILNKSLKDSYDRLIRPHLIREIRSELKQMANKASYEVFSNNLHHLLLTNPTKGKKILGMDPGFTGGCKLALISETGAVLDTEIIHPHRGNPVDAIKLRTLLKNYNCTLIALGNGTACRETENWLADLIQKKTFAPLNVVYTIVNESGASIYSCSPEAKKEFPKMSPNLISAVSLARRIQEPIAELVKVEPQHLGVGMYQHDLPKKQLEEALDEVITECVSFVGVDLNTASQCLLKRIAGLNEKTAEAIIERRSEKGMFYSREELKSIHGIGPKVFQQCSGFVRVGPALKSHAHEFYQHPETNKLDCTYIHPESYDVARKLIEMFDLNVKDVGQSTFIQEVKRRSADLNIEECSGNLNSSVETVKLILDTLSKPLNFDMREERAQVPLFKKGVTNIADLKIGSILTGSVGNVVHFGCFVDIGVGINGLLHTKSSKGTVLQIGERVEVKVINIEIERKRIGLEFVKKL